MKAEALLAKQPEPTREEIAHALLGNLCRCTGYVKIVDAIELAAAAPARRAAARGRPQRPGRRAHGAATRATSSRSATSRTSTTWSCPGCCTARCASPTTRGRASLRIDTVEAQAHPGVVAVVTAADVPGERTQGAITRDWRQLVAEGETTAYVGDVLAAVAADTRHAAREAAALIEVEYEVLEPVTDPFEALRRRAAAARGGNVLSVSRSSAATSTRRSPARRTSSPRRSAPSSSSTPSWSRSRRSPSRRRTAASHVYSQGQGVWDDRRQVASFLGLPEERVRVTQVSTGGAFGAKEDLNVQGHAALLAPVTGRPVLAHAQPRGEPALPLEAAPDVAGVHASAATPTAACSPSRARIVGDTGAYASVGDKVLERAAGHACSAYEVPNVDVEAPAVYTNNPPCGAMRGFGVNQSNFAIEGMLDRLAEQVGIDGWEIRWRNALDVGRPLRHRAAARPGRRPEADAARRARRLPRRAVRRASPAA